VKPLGGAREVPELGDGCKAAKLVKLHVLFSFDPLASRTEL
jgi:hypothetical protein